MEAEIAHPHVVTVGIYERGLNFSEPLCTHTLLTAVELPQMCFKVRAAFIFFIAQGVSLFLTILRVDLRHRTLAACVQERIQTYAARGFLFQLPVLSRL